MTKLIEAWEEGVSWLICDELVSFYSFFTIIFAECAYLRRFFATSIIVPFTIILIGYIVNVIVCALLKGYFGTARVSVIAMRMYLIVFVVLFAIGCFIDIKMSIILTIIPLFLTLISVGTREIVSDEFFMIISIIISVVVPFILFAISIFMLPKLSIVLKVVILVLYALFSPFLSYIEDDTATQNIFELAFEKNL